MPVLSPRRSSATLTGSYRSSSIDRPLYNTSHSFAPRSTSYSERFSSRSYVDSDGRSYFMRQGSITEDGVTTRFRERDSLSRDSGIGSARENSILRDNSLSRISAISVVESVAEMRNKYSPSNYVPACMRKNDLIDSKSKNINDIGKPPIDLKVNESLQCNGLSVTSLSNTTNLDNISNDDDNGNRASVGEIKKRFESDMPILLSTGSKNFLVVEGTGIKIAENHFKKQDYQENSFSNSMKGKPAKLSKLDSYSSNKLSSDRQKQEKLTKSKVSDGREVPQNGDAASNTHLQVEFENNGKLLTDTTTGEFSKNFNHTNNFASYIPYKDLEQRKGENNDMENRNLIGENRDSGHYYQASKLNDIVATSQLNRIPGTSANASNKSQRANNSIEPEAFYEKSHGASNPIKNLGLNGLKNIGNTCFMNSVIQCLSNTKLLLEYVKNDMFTKDINTSISSMKGALIKAFSQVIKELWSEDSSDRVVNTVSLKSQIQRFASRFMGYSQQDAQEFLRYLLEGLHEDVNRIITKPAPNSSEIDEKLNDCDKASEAWHRYLRLDNSKVVDIFVGQLKSTLRCTHCGHCSVTFDPFWDLSLPIPQRVGQLRLQQCLDYFTREETLDGDEKPTCSKCKERRKCTKSFAIQKFPKILVIHLKRFSPTERFRGKLSTPIDFPIDGLDMRDYAAESNPGECRYNLYAISNHSGSTYSGHYTAYCRHPYSLSWHEYNDSRVCSISSKTLVSGEAYVLFYELENQKKSHL